MSHGIRIAPKRGGCHPVTFWTGRLEQVVAQLDRLSWPVELS